MNDSSPDAPRPPIFPRWLVAIAGVALAASLGYALRGVLAPLFLAFLLAYALDPLVDRLGRARVPRSVAAPLVMVALVAVLGVVVFVAVPYMIGEFAAAAQRVPEQLAGFHVRAERLLDERFHTKLPASFGELLTQYGSELRGYAPDASKVMGWLFGTMSAIAVLLGSLIVPIFALYLLGDFDAIVDRAYGLVPRRWAPRAHAIAGEIHGALGRYLRGQILTNLILAVLYAVGLRIVGLRLAIPIGILTGLLSFIPYAGVAIGATLAVAMALLDWHSSGQLAGVGVVMITVFVLDGMVITPRIVGGSVGLKPLEVLIAMMAAGALFGFLGVLLAVPIGAVAKILIGHGVDAYLASSFYRRSPTAGVAGVEDTLPTARDLSPASAEDTIPDPAPAP